CPRPTCSVSTSVMTGDPYTSPEFAKAALVTIDTQRDVLDGAPFEIAGTSAALTPIRALLEAFREAGRPIVHVVRLYQPDGVNADLSRRRALEEGLRVLVAGDRGSELAEELLPQPDVDLNPELLLAGGIQSLGPNEVAIYKPRWGAFYRTPLEAHLRDLSVSTLVFSGCNFPNCPRTSVYEASERDFRVVVVEDAISGLYDRGRSELKGIGVSVLTSAEVVQAVQVAAGDPLPSA
ncbi:MAG TPA: isochorismatase family cysteine hydrolase, partial [Solirubrobacteraceae bacterium]|nr:isochorismatase family cysteine hydrolase [Solirubrobacteraceae bacterium]